MAPEPSAEAVAQLRLRYRLAAAAADAYIDEGFAVVLEDVAAGPLLPEAVAMVRSRPVHLFVLMPSLEAVIRRDAARSASGYETWSPKRLYDAFAKDTPRVGTWLDTSHQTPSETVEDVVSRVSVSSET